MAAKQTVRFWPYKWSWAFLKGLSIAEQSYWSRKFRDFGPPFRYSVHSEYSLDPSQAIARKSWPWTIIMSRMEKHTVILYTLLDSLTRRTHISWPRPFVHTIVMVVFPLLMIFHVSFSTPFARIRNNMNSLDIVIIIVLVFLCVPAWEYMCNIISGW